MFECSGEMTDFSFVVTVPVDELDEKSFLSVVITDLILNKTSSEITRRQVIIAWTIQDSSQHSPSIHRLHFWCHYSRSKFLCQGRRGTPCQKWKILFSKSSSCLDSFSSSVLVSSLSSSASDNQQLDGEDLPKWFKFMIKVFIFRMFDSDQTSEMVSILYQVSDLYIQAMGWNIIGDPGGGELMFE